MAKKEKNRLVALEACLNEYAGRYESLGGVSDFGAYVTLKNLRADEEILTEPVLDCILRKVLGFPTDAYFPQLGKGGRKPDFTPGDLIAHPFVLDAKATSEDLRSHEPQIRRYMTQRSLDFGVLFALREFQVFRAGSKGADPTLSFALLPVWQAARGEAMPTTGDVGRFETFCEQFAFREMGVAEKIEHVRSQPTWTVRLGRGDPLEVDVEFLVQQLRRLSRLLADDVARQSSQLDTFLAVNPGREERVLRELELLTLDLSPGTDLTRLPKQLDVWRVETGLPKQVWRQYCLRVAYLVLTRILLYRAWEDVGFVDEYLYDGGFDQAYERLSQNLSRVLTEAFLHGAERYRWLYGGDNNYDWYRPRDAALIEVLYSLAPVPLGKLNADVLGALYLSYVDEIDRDRLGQFFTPRAVVRFMLDRAGFVGADSVFRLEGDVRRPVRVFDFATGSGGFLVEAARRIIDLGGLDLSDHQALREGLAAIVTGFYGSEISPFPYYLTEVNLLLQVSRLLGPLALAGEPPPPFVLGVLHADSLATKSGMRSFDEIEVPLRADRVGLMKDERFDLTPLQGEKLDRYRRLHDDEAFDLVIGNPPYVTEANNRLLFERLRSIPAWEGIYKGKTDYLYYFLLLALDKLAPGGTLCVITPAGWMNAAKADFLRERLASSLRLDAIFLFGSYRLFAPEEGAAPTPTVESAVLVGTKTTAPETHTFRVVALEDEAEAAKALADNPEAKTPEREALLDEMVRRAGGKPGRAGGIHVHDVAQADLRPEHPWPIKVGAEDVAARVVAHLQRLLDDETAPVGPFSETWKIFQGIQTGADAYTKRIQKRLTPEVRHQIEASGGGVGDPILELPPGAEGLEPWRSYPELLVRSPEPSALHYGAIDEADYASIVLLTSKEPPVDVLKELDRWRPLLATRAEIARNDRRRWWETAWRRNSQDLTAPKTFTVNRTDRPRFSLDEEGSWQPTIKFTAVVGRHDQAPVAYACGLLNSELLDLWYAVRGRNPWHDRRNYEPKRMNEIPYRWAGGDERAEQIGGLVRRIAANRRSLLPYRTSVFDLGRIMKNPWRSGPVVVNLAGLLAELGTGETISVRVDPELELKINAPNGGKAIRIAPDVLAFTRGKTEAARVAGDPARLDLLEEIAGNRRHDDPGALILPKDVEGLRALGRERRDVVAGLLGEGRQLVEEVERLVCSLYEVPDHLAEEVVSHAVRRASVDEYSSQGVSENTDGS